jgi:hypothetical protein
LLRATGVYPLVAELLNGRLVEAANSDYALSAYFQVLATRQDIAIHLRKEIGRSALDTLCDFGNFRQCLRIALPPWLKVIHRRLYGTSPQSTQAQGIDDFGRPPRRSPSKDRPVAAPGAPRSIVATKDIAWGLRRGIPRSTSAAFGPHAEFGTWRGHAEFLVNAFA